MRIAFYVLITLCLLLNACAPAATEAVLPSPPAETATVTATESASLPPTKTPTSSKPTSTSPPSFPTQTPTFDISKIATATPAQRAICPVAAPLENPDFGFLNLWDPSSGKSENLNKIHAEENILSFLNTYGAQPLVTHLQYTWRTEGHDFAYQDLTNDNVPELAIGAESFYIFGCRNGQYEKLFETPPDPFLNPAQIFSIKDNNRNGVNEIVLRATVTSQGGRAYIIYEWAETGFHDLLLPRDKDYPELGGSIFLEATGTLFFSDVDHDLMNELVSDSGIPIWSTYNDFLPWRNKRTIYDWNGEHYIPTHYEFADPEFRFQAVQDGDLAASQGEFDKALGLYQSAIFSDTLKGYSPGIRKNIQERWLLQFNTTKVPPPTPYPDDPNEYPALAAYAYYRIMLIHVIRGYISDAGTVLNTMRKKFPADSPGYPYVEMADTFMFEYQTTQNIACACNSAFQFANTHPQILVPLGNSDYHGFQSHRYKPEDVCPFR